MNLFTKKFKKIIEEDITGSSFHNSPTDASTFGSQGDIYAPGTAITPTNSKNTKKKRSKKKINKEISFPVPFKRTFPELLLGPTGSTTKIGL
jgi:hypothetical protein